MTYNTSPDQIIGGNLVDPRDTNVTNDPLNVIGTVAIEGDISTEITGGTFSIDNELLTVGGTVSLDSSNPVETTGTVSLGNELLTVGGTVSVQDPVLVNVDNETGTGAKPVYGIFGELMTGQKVDEISVQFHNGINYEYDCTGSTSGDGEILGTNSMAVIQSTTGTSCLRSKDSIAYRPGHTGYGDFTASFDGTGIGEAGISDCDNGFFIGKTNGTMCVGYKNTGVDTVVYSGQWNNPDLVLTRDVTKPQIYRIMFGYLGVADPIFQIWRDGHFKTFHRIETAGNLDWTHVGTPIFNVRCYTSGDMKIKTGSWGAGFLAGSENSVGNRFFTFPITPLVDGSAPEPNQYTLSSTDVLTLGIFQNKDDFQDKTNKTKAILTAYEFHVPTPSGNVYGDVIVQLVKNATLTGTPTYNDINTDSSVIEYDTTGTGATVDYSSGGRIALTEVVSYIGANRSGSVSRNIPITAKHDLFLYPGESMTILAKDRGGNGVDIMPMFSWEEIH